MWNKTPLLLVWLVLFACVLCSRGFAKVQGTRPSGLRVSVFNDAGVTTGKLLQAEKVASAVFVRSGITVEWLNCGRKDETTEEQATCSEVNSPEHLHLRILAHSLNLKASTLGISYLDEAGEGSAADVFYEGLVQLEQREGTRGDVLLGVVMAHELGHLLLGTNSHALTGLMRPVWNADDLAAAGKSRLVFSEEQNRKMRARLQASVATAAD